MKRLKIYFISLCVLFCVASPVQEASGQSVFAVTVGTGMASGRLFPKQETKGMWGKFQAGFSWRYYSLPKVVGCIGVDVEWIQRGFSYAPYASMYEEKSDYRYYTRNLNSIMIPIVWQPHVYMFKRHFRLYLEAAFTVSYNFAATFDNREPFTFGPFAPSDAGDRISGKYDLRIERDNRFGYGLAGGGGFDILIKQIEFGVRVRYNFGYSDIMKNRNKYYDNTLDQEKKPGENPFWYTPLRSPLDNLTISLRVGFRMNKEGFKSWTARKNPKIKNKNPEIFKLD